MTAVLTGVAAVGLVFFLSSPSHFSSASADDAHDFANSVGDSRGIQAAIAVRTTTMEACAQASEKIVSYFSHMEPARVMTHLANFTAGCAFRPLESAAHKVVLYVRSQWPKKTDLSFRQICSDLVSKMKKGLQIATGVPAELQYDFTCKATYKSQTSLLKPERKKQLTYYETTGLDTL
jgi:hypothetical protein